MPQTRRPPSASSRIAKVSFIEPMECLPVAKIPEGPDWTYEIKLDGYRLEAVKSRGKVTLYSRRRNILNSKFGYIAEALKELPDDTVLDGELVASTTRVMPTSTCSRTSSPPSRISTTTPSTF